MFGGENMSIYNGIYTLKTKYKQYRVIEETYQSSEETIEETQNIQ